MDKRARVKAIMLPQGKTRIYIGCSLTHAPEAFRMAVESLKQELRQQFEIFDFLGLVAGTAEDVYRWDINKCVAEADLFVAICDYTSLGLGYEIGTAVEKHHKPVLAVAHQDAHISRLILGVTEPCFDFKRYKEFSEVAGLVKAFAAAQS
jgi:hypothetical protein